MKKKCCRDTNETQFCSGCRISEGLTSPLIILLKPRALKRPGSVSNNLLHILLHAYKNVCTGMQPQHSKQLFKKWDPCEMNDLESGVKSAFSFSSGGLCRVWIIRTRIIYLWNWGGSWVWGCFLTAAVSTLWITRFPQNRNKWHRGFTVWLRPLCFAELSICGSVKMSSKPHSLVLTQAWRCVGAQVSFLKVFLPESQHPLCPEHKDHTVHFYPECTAAAPSRGQVNETHLRWCGVGPYMMWV